MLISVLSSLTTSMSAFSTDLRTGPLGEHLADNVPNGPFDMPVLIGQGASDTLITPDVVAAYAESLCDTGADVDYRTYDGKDHVGLVAPDSPLLPELVTWTQEQLAAETAPIGCVP